MIDLIEIRRMVQAMNEIKDRRFYALCLVLMGGALAYAIHGGGVAEIIRALAGH